MTGSYTEVQRRAANQIWGAAGHYDVSGNTQSGKQAGFLYESGHRTCI